MKKLVVLLVSVVVISVLGWFTYDLISNDGKSDTELITFNIEDIDSVDKVIISDSQGNTFEIVKKGSNNWTDKNGGCIQQESVGFILDAFKNIEFKGYLPENSREPVIKRMITNNIKVEIFQSGEWVKTWYIGSATQDHAGQMMLLDSEEFGKSDLPVVMKIKGVNGIIEPRFFADPRKWMCTNIFALSPEQISKVDVKFIQESFRSFTVTKNKNRMNVFQQGKLLPQVDTAMAYRYLKNFEKIHFNVPNYELSPKQVDSVKKSTPFVILNLTETNHKKTTLRMFKIATKESRVNDFGVEEKTDGDKFWCQLDNGQLVKCQFFALNPILMGHIYFPMNLPSNPMTDK